MNSSVRGCSWTTRHPEVIPSACRSVDVALPENDPPAPMSPAKCYQLSTICAKMSIPENTTPHLAWISGWRQGELSTK